MKHRLTLLVVAAFLLGGTGGCNVDVTKEGELPNVTVDPGKLPEVKVLKEGEMPSIDVQGGKLPQVDVDAPEVDVSTKPKKVETPDIDIDVDTKEKTVEVPEVDVQPPADE